MSNDEVVSRSGLKKSDITECAETIRQAYAINNIDERDQLVKNCSVTMKSSYKDQAFYS